MQKFKGIEERTMKRIQSMRIEITPDETFSSNYEYYVVRVDIDISLIGERSSRFSSKEMFHYSDFTSRFEHLFNGMKNIIREAIMDDENAS